MIRLCSTAETTLNYKVLYLHRYVTIDGKSTCDLVKEFAVVVSLTIYYLFII